MKKVVALFGFLLLGLGACGSDDLVIVETSGIIIDAGDVAADGCGWVVEINGTQFSPTYLSPQYQVSGLNVLLKVEFLTTTFNCGLQGAGLDQIRIEQIRPSGN